MNPEAEACSCVMPCKRAEGSGNYHGPIEACASGIRCICAAKTPLLVKYTKILFVGKTFFGEESLQTTKYLERTWWVYEGGQRV